LTIGTAVDFLAQHKTATEEDLRAGRTENFQPAGEAHRAYFIVTQEDIHNAIKLIDSQQAEYREPKTRLSG
jgi:hypothetical protein